MALNYGALTALTRDKYVPKLVDNFFKSTPLLAMLRDRQKEWNGGPAIVEPLIHGELSGGTSFSGYDTVTYPQTTPITAAKFDPKFLVQPVIIADTEVEQNTGPEQVLSLLEAKMEIARLTLSKLFSTQLYADGTGNSGKDITGLGAVLSTTSTYGGIAVADMSTWAAKVNALSPAQPLTTALMRKMFLDVSDGNDKPDVIITTKALWNRYAELAEGRITVTSSVGEKLANLGFQVLEFMGVPVVWDADCPAGYMYFLNTKYLQLRVSPRMNFTATKWHRADNMIADKCEILWGGNLTCNQRRRQGLITGLDESGY